MCGFVGRINKNLDDFISEEELRSSLDSIVHRGPDDEGYYISKNIGFAHRRLSIIDVFHGHQPMEYKKNNRNVVLIYNGETYNFQDLRRKIISKGQELTSYCDTEVILLMYILYGKKSFKLLNGMYAFAIYDFDLDELILCRDRFGIKPLYYMDTEMAFSFASEVKALKKFRDFSFNVNNESISEYLTFQFYISNQTPFKNIYSVPSASYLVLKNNEFTIHKYYETNLEVDDSITYEEAKQNIVTLLEDSIKKNTISDVQIGSYLSGGIDSSIITSVLGVSKFENLTFSGAFDVSSSYDESQYIDAVTKKYKMENHKVYPTLNDFIGSFDDITKIMDFPSSGPGVFPQYYVSKLASENVKVILGGQGGDEIFGGYARYFIAYFEQALKGSIEGTQDSSKHMAILSDLIKNLPMIKDYTPMLKSFWQDGLFDEKEKRYFDLINRRSSVKHIFQQDFLNELSDEKNYEKFLNVFGDKTTPYFNRMTNFDLNYSLQGLLHVEDRVSMANSLESRVPFLDYRLIDFVNSIQPKYKFRDGKLKSILIDSFKDILPKKVINRVDKKGFPVPFNEWKNETKMKEFLADNLLSQKSLNRGFYDRKTIEEEIFKKQGFSRGLWGVLNLERWLQLNE